MYNIAKDDITPMASLSSQYFSVLVPVFECAAGAWLRTRAAKLDPERAQEKILGFRRASLPGTGEIGNYFF